MQIIVPQAVGLHLTRADEGIVALQSDIAAYLSRRPIEPWWSVTGRIQTAGA